MILAHSRPSGINWTVSGTGAAILSPTDELDDGMPGTKTRFQWLSGAQSSLTSILRLRADWSGIAIVPRLVGLHNLSLPHHTLIYARFRRASDTLGTYPYAPPSYNDGQRVLTDPRGGKSWWNLIEPGATPVLGVEFAIWNNIDGVATIPASSLFTIGEAVIAAGDEFEIDKQWSQYWVDPTTTRYARRQPYPRLDSPYRVLDWRFPRETLDSVYGTAADNREALLARMDRGQSCVWVPRYRVDGAFDSNLMHRTAMVGTATELPKIAHTAGDVFTSGRGLVMEAPIPS